jgi:heme-degrading monooxygenase HmoA
MFIILWEYTVRPEHQPVFLKYYEAKGEWANFFRQADDYIATELLAMDSDELIFMTIDRWKTQQAYRQFINDHSERYHELDRLCEELTTQEKLIGQYFTVD